MILMFLHGAIVLRSGYCKGKDVITPGIQKGRKQAELAPCTKDSMISGLPSTNDMINYTPRIAGRPCDLAMP